MKADQRTITVPLKDPTGFWEKRFLAEEEPPADSMCAADLARRLRITVSAADSRLRRHEERGELISFRVRRRLRDGKLAVVKFYSPAPSDPVCRRRTIGKRAAS